MGMLCLCDPSAAHQTKVVVFVPLKKKKTLKKPCKRQLLKQFIVPMYISLLFSLFFFPSICE